MHKIPIIIYPEEIWTYIFYNNFGFKQSNYDIST